MDRCGRSALPFLAFFAAHVALAQRGQTADLTVPQLAAKARSAVVTIHVLDAGGQRIALGSGFIAPDGRIVTNRHVIAGGSRAEIFGSEGQMLVIAPYAEAISDEMDLAILPAVPNAPGHLALASALPATGTPVVVFGAPQGLENTVSEGIVSALRELNPGRILQITAPISAGSSGGPVLDHRGDVVGVATLQLTGGQNLNFAVPAEAVRAVLGSPSSKIPFPVTTVAPGSAAAAPAMAAPPATAMVSSRLIMGPRWTLASRNDRVAIGVDTSHAQVDEELHRYYTVWVRVQWAQDQTASQGQRYTAMVSRTTIDCRERRSRTLGLVVYDSLNAVNSFQNRNAPWETPIPDSIGESVVTGVCTVLRDR